MSITNTAKLYNFYKYQENYFKQEAKKSEQAYMETPEYKEHERWNELYKKISQALKILGEEIKDYELEGFKKDGLKSRKYGKIRELHRQVYDIDEAIKYCQERGFTEALKVDLYKNQFKKVIELAKPDFVQDVTIQTFILNNQMED